MPVKDIQLPIEEAEKIKRICLNAEMVRVIKSGDRPLIELKMRIVHKHLCKLDLDLMLAAKPKAVGRDLETIRRNLDEKSVRWIDPTDLPVCRIHMEA